MTRLCAFALMVACFISCEEPDSPKPAPEDEAPTEITLDNTSYEVAQEGETIQLGITAPERPKVTSDKKWIKIIDGTYNKYKITVGLEIAPNDSYEQRTAEISVRSGSLSKVVTISQKAKEVIVKEYPENTGNDAWQMAEKLGFGWNMGNQMEAHNNGKVQEGCWTNTLATQATFDGVKAKGVKSVRIPISWMDQIGPAPEYKLGDRLERVAEILGYAKKADLIAIINIHHDGADDDYWLNLKDAAGSDVRNEEIKAQIAAVWKQVAERFKDEGDWLIFESFNEIHDGGWGWSAAYQTEAGKKKHNDILNSWNQLFVDVVRATGGCNSTRWLGVPGYCASPEFTLESFVLPTDPAGRIMVSFHEYTPYKFCQTAEDSEWGHTRKSNLSDPSYDESYMEDIFSQFYHKYVKNNIPVYVGEFGCTNRPEGRARKYQLYYLEYMSKCAATYGMSGFIWDNTASNTTPSVGNESYGIVDHGTGEYVGYGKNIFDACKKGFYTDSESYTLKTVYNSAP